MNFDKNTIIGFVLIAAILVIYGIWQQPSEAEKIAMAQQRDSLIQVQKQLDAQEILRKNTVQSNDIITSSEEPDSIKQKRIASKFGAFANSASGEKKYTTLENNLLKITISNLGGKIKSVELKNYKAYSGAPLLLFDGDSTIFGIGISSIGQNTNDLFFVQNSGTQNMTVSTNDSLSVSFRLYADSSSYIEYIYTLSDNAYDLKFEIKTVEFEQYISNQYLTLNWDTYIRSSEKGKTWENDNSTIHYQYLEDEHDYISSHSKDEENEKLTGRVKWVAFKHHFFSSIIIADEHFLRGGAITSTPLPLSDNHVKRFSAVLDLPYEKNKSQNLKFYFGPNHYPTLKSYDLGLEQLLDLGWGIFAWLNKYAVIPIFNWLSKYFVNFGLIIFLLTVIIKIVLFPLTYKSYLSTAKMRVLKPEVDKLNEKFDKSEALKKQQAVMELYRKAGVNPMGGCIPMLIQLPILYAMFRFFPASIELRQESFLWAEDLSTYDSIMTLPFEIPWYGSHVSLFTLLMAVSMIFTTVLSNKNMTTMPGQPNMKFMMWMMPIMMLFWFNSYSSGLSYYYFVANMITLIQTWIIKATIDDDALLSKLKANTKIPRKKSRFQQRLEDIQKQQKSLKK